MPSRERHDQATRLEALAALERKKANEHMELAEKNCELFRWVQWEGLVNKNAPPPSREAGRGLCPEM